MSWASTRKKVLAPLALTVAATGLYAGTSSPQTEALAPDAVAAGPSSVTTETYSFAPKQASESSSTARLAHSASQTGAQATTLAPVEGFGSMGVTWRAAGAPAATELHFTYRTKEAGRWSGWEEFHTDDLHGPDRGAQEATQAKAGTDLILLGEVDQVEVQVAAPEELPEALELTVISPETPKLEEAKPEIAYAASTARPTIYSRAQWGANEKLRDPKSLTYAKVQGAFVHHTAGSNEYTKQQVPGIIASIYSYHVKTRGWSDIGYNFLIDRFGRIWEGRYGGVDKAVQGAHTLGYNHVAFAASALGNFETAKPTSATIQAYGSLLAWKLSHHGVNLKQAKVNLAGKTLNLVSGHRDVGATACPGANLYSQLTSIRSLVSSGVPLPDPTAPATPAAAPELSDEKLAPDTSPVGGTVAAKPVVKLQKNLVGSSLPDILARTYDSKKIYAIPTGGFHELRKPATVSTGWSSKTTTMLSPDLTGDGIADLVTLKKGELKVRPGTSSGGYSNSKAKGAFSQKGFEVYTGLTPAGDLNRDGRNDFLAKIASGKKAGQPVALLRKGNKFVKRKLTVGGSGNWKNLTSLRSAGDLNSDGYPDFIAIRKSTKRPAMVKSLGKQKYAKSTLVKGSWTGFTDLVGGADFDGDGKQDLVYRRAGGAIHARLGLGNGTFQGDMGPIASTTFTTSLYVGKLGDGKPGLVGRRGKVLQALKDSGKFGLGTPVYLGITMPTAIDLFHAGDWNGDGYGDVMAVRENGTLIVRTGNGQGQLSTAVSLGKGFAEVTDLEVVGDQTGDGRPDIYGVYQGKPYVWPGQRMDKLKPALSAPDLVPPSKAAFMPAEATGSRYDWRGVTTSLQGVAGDLDVVARETKTGQVYGYSKGSTTARFMGRGLNLYDLLD